uniref:Cytochrome P450 n=1 Tax=Plectus sambesii TaxID=2011161 RepID=A0A914UV68_9BILA
MLFVIAFTIICLYFIYDYVCFVKKYPPGPFPFPVVGNCLSLDPEAPHESIAAFGRKYGPIFTVWLPKPHIVISDYELMKQALVKDGDNFAGRFRGNVFSLFANGNHGISLADGAIWKEQRKFAMHTLKSFGMGRNVIEAKIHVSINKLIEWIDDDLSKSTEKVLTTDLSWSLQQAVGNVINSVVIGYHFEKDDPRFFRLKTILEEFFDTVRRPGLIMLENGHFWLRHIPFTGRMGLDSLMVKVKRVQDFMKGEIEAHQKDFDENEEPTDFIAAYMMEMARRRKTGEDMSYFSDWQMQCTLLDIWGAGMLPTVTMMRWALLFMLHYPDVQERVQYELDTIVGKDRQVEMADKPFLPYTTATVTEIQRFANIIPINQPRKVFEDTVINGYRIPGNTPVLAQIHTVLQDPKLFPQPERFNPDRFLDETKQKFINNEAVIPYGIGKRMCLGESLARTEIFLFFAALLQRFSFAAPKGQPISLQKPKFGINLMPENYEVEIRSR